MLGRPRAACAGAVAARTQRTTSPSLLTHARCAPSGAQATALPMDRWHGARRCARSAPPPSAIHVRSAPSLQAAASRRPPPGCCRTLNTSPDCHLSGTAPAASTAAGCSTAACPGAARLEPPDRRRHRAVQLLHAIMHVSVRQCHYNRASAPLSPLGLRQCIRRWTACVSANATPRATHTPRGMLPLVGAHADRLRPDSRTRSVSLAGDRAGAALQQAAGLQVPQVQRVRRRRAQMLAAAASSQELARVHLLCVRKGQTSATSVGLAPNLLNDLQMRLVAMARNGTRLRSTGISMQWCIAQPLP